MAKRLSSKLLDKLSPNEGMLLMLLAVIVGAVTGVAAVIFIRLIAFIQIFSYTHAEMFPAFGRLWIIFVPVAGALLAGPIISRFAKEAKGHGVPEVMQALILRGGRIRPRVALAKIVASALCIGTGGSAGREGPIVQVGSTLGSALGQWLRLSDERIKNLVACGAAAGIAATFNAPIAGVVFALEVLMSELQLTVFGNVVLSAVSASIISQIFLGARPAFEVPAYTLNSPWEILLYLALGLLAALVGIMFIKMLDTFDNIFDRWKFSSGLKPAVGALFLGLLAYYYPNLHRFSSGTPEDFRLGMPLMENIPHIYASGFEFIEEVLLGNAPFFLVALLIILKPLATSFTLGSGNSGGIFAPSLFTGAMLGGTFGYIANVIFPEIASEIGAYALVGMAAVFAAAAHAPLTSILIVFEMSNDYSLILPLMAAGMVASTIAHWLHPESIYTIKLVKRGIHFEHGRDMGVMQNVSVREVMNRHPITVEADQAVAEVFSAFQKTHLQGFPVLDKNRLYGIITVQDVERALSENNLDIRQTKIRDIATASPITVFPDETVWSAIRKMAPRDLARLPVVDRRDKKNLLGLVSRSDILRAYNVGIIRKQQVQKMLDSRRSKE